MDLLYLLKSLIPKDRKILVNQEITDLLAQQELVRLTPETVDDLISLIEHSLDSCQLVPVVIYPESGHYAHSGIVGNVRNAIRLSCERHEFPGDPSQNYLRITFNPAAVAMPFSCYYNSESLLTWYSNIPSPGDTHSCHGLYLKLECDGLDREVLLLKTPFCREHLPNVFKEFEKANAYYEMNQKLTVYQGSTPLKAIPYGTQNPLVTAGMPFIFIMAALANIDLSEFDNNCSRWL